MQVALFFFSNIALFACVLFCFSDGVPAGSLYSRQEEELILKELVSHRGSCHKKWKVIEALHEKLRKARAPGFSKKRSAKALQAHFGRDTKKSTGIKVPDHVKELHGKKIVKYYNAREHEFINEELRTSDGPLYHYKTWEEIKRKHDKERESGTRGFIHKRTWRSLRVHFQKVMVPNGLVDEDVKQRFSDCFKTGQGLDSIGAKESTTGRSEHAAVRYSQEEDDLIIKELEFHAWTHNVSPWEAIAKAQKNKLKEKAPGFSTPRSANNIRKHFVDTIMRNMDDEVPDIVKQLYYVKPYKHYSPEEEEFINKQICSCQGTLLGEKLWLEMEKHHNEIRKSGSPGFTHRRTWSSLRTHFLKVMIPNDLVNEAVKKRFWDSFNAEKVECSRTIPDSNCTEREKQADAENVDIDSNTEDDVWGPILEDLKCSQQFSVT